MKRRHCADVRGGEGSNNIFQRLSGGKILSWSGLAVPSFLSRGLELAGDCEQNRSDFLSFFLSFF